MPRALTLCAATVAIVTAPFVLASCTDPPTGGEGEGDCEDDDTCAASVCDTDNGGCGNPEFWRCTGSTTAVCADIDECATQNGHCGNPAYNSCENQEGGPPRCSPNFLCPLALTGAACTADADCCSAHCDATGVCSSSDPHRVDLGVHWDVQANLVRLDDTTLVAAYTLPPPDQAATEFFLRAIEVVDDEISAGEPARFAQDIISANTTSGGIPMMGALGANHFVVVTVSPPPNIHTLHFFRRDGSSFTLLDSVPSTFGEYGGHPIDDTRYLLRYRETAGSDSPVTYRVLRLDGDTLVTGAPLVRPPPTDFAGLDPAEPQVFSPLMRTGPNTFREIRGGYVQEPGYLAAWTLTLNEDDALSSSDPIVFTTSAERTMTPSVVSNGNGDGVVFYVAWQVGWHRGFLSAGASHYEELGSFGDDPSDDRVWGSQAHETTDGYFDGSYYMRAPSGVLYRFDDAGVVQDTIPNVSSLFCPYSPSMLRLGSMAAFLVCGTSGDGLHIRFIPL